MKRINPNGCSKILDDADIANDPNNPPNLPVKMWEGDVSRIL